jgi:branched-chain amino acid transport system substrate-binding protein
LPAASDRASSPLLALLTLASLAALAAGCSLDGFQFQACKQHAECRESLGFGAVCGKDGLCQQVQPSARCTSSYPDDLFSAPLRYRQTHVLASLMDRSSEAHVTREKAIRLAVKEANAAGGLEGRDFALVMCDIRADPSLDDLPRTAAAVASATFVSRTLGVSAIIGPSASTDVEQVWQAVQDAGTLVISPAATSPALAGLETSTTEQRPGLLWRVAPTDSLQGRVIAEDMLARKVSKALVIRETGSYGEGLASVFSERFRQGGGSTVLVSIASEAQAQSAAAGLAAEDPEEVLFVSSQQAWIVAFLTAAGREPSYAARSIFLTDAAANQAVLTGAASAAGIYPHVRGTRPAPRDPSEYVLASFIADFRAEYAGALPTTATFSAHAFDATWLALYGAAHAVLREQHLTGEGIGRGLRRVASGADVPILQASWPQVLAAFRAGNSINVRGASGDLDFDPISRELAAPIEIWTIGSMAGQFTMVKLDTRTPSVQ